MKKIAFVSLLCLLSNCTFAQQYSLYNTRTLFDSFENPSQKAFQVDSSSKYAFNFLIPTLASNTAFVGPAQSSFKDLAFKGVINGNVPLGVNGKNTLILNSNAYLLMFKLFKDVSFNKELGFSWQLRQNLRLLTTNETFAVFDNAERFNNLVSTNIFNNKGTSQAYHQFSFTYREDYNKRLGLGIKLSLLSGIAYNQLNVIRSSLNFDKPANHLDIQMQGTYRSNFSLDTIDRKMLLPIFKNPGVSLSTSANLKLKGGWFLLGNIKDLGFIRWNKSSYSYPFNGAVSLDNASSRDSRQRLADEIANVVTYQGKQENFISPTNARIDILVNKDLNRYQPNLIVAKDIFQPGGDIALINNYQLRNLVFSVSSAYNLNNFFQLGGQLMYKTPNVEIFAGSDQMLPTYYTAKNILARTSTTGKKHTGASFYFGFGLKFGSSMEHPLNSRTIPGIDNTRHVKSGFFRRFFSGIGRGKKEKS